MRKRFKIPLFGAVLVALAVIVGLVLLYQSHILENRVNRYLAEQLADKYGLEVIISEIDGSFVNGFVLRDVMVRYSVRDTSYTLAMLPRVAMKYKVSNFWNLQWILDSLEMDNPRVYLPRDDSGHFVLPVFGADSTAARTLPSWEVSNIILRDGEVEIKAEDTTYLWFGVYLAATAKSDEGTITVNTEAMRFNSTDSRVKVNHLSGRATVFHKSIALQNIKIETDSSQLAFSLMHDNRDGRWTEVQIQSAHIHLPDIVSFVGSGLAGNIDLNGTIYQQAGKLGGDVTIAGTFEDRRFDSLDTQFHLFNSVLYLDTLHGLILEGCRVNGYGSINFATSPKGYFLSADISNLNLINLIFGSFTSNLSGHIELTGRGLRSKTMAIDIDTDLDESWFDIYHFHKGTGQLTISNHGLYFFPGFKFDYYENRFWCEGGVEYKGNISIDGKAALSNLSRFEHQTFIDLPAGTGQSEFSFTGPTGDPTLSGSFHSDSVFFYDFYSSDFAADFSIDSFTKRKQGPVYVWSHAGDAWDFPYDSIYAEFTLDSNLLHIDTVNVANQFSVTQSHGALDYEKYPQELNLDVLQIEMSDRYFYSDGIQKIRVDSAGFIFDDIRIKSESGSINLAGRADYDETLNLSWIIQNITIGPWVDLMNDSIKINGILSSTGKIRGPFSNPFFALEGILDSLSYKGLGLGDLRAFLTYEDTTLYIDSSYLKSPEGRYTAEGYFPINLILSMDHDVFDDREQNITIHAEDNRLDLASFVLESVEYMTGDFVADIVLTGKPVEPHLNGDFVLTNGEIKLIDLKDKLEQVEIALDMSDRLVTIEKAQALVPRDKKDNPGIITATGTILINDISNFTYAIGVTCKNMPLNYELGNFTGLADADIRVEGPTPPTVRGRILMHHAVYGESFEDETGFSLLTALEADKTWNLDLMVECPSNFWTKNDDVDAEYSGNLNIKRNAGVYNFLGTLEVVRGKYFLFDKTYRMTPGGQIIYENIEELDPRLNLEITTRIRTQTQYTGFETENSYSYELPLMVTGTLKNPIISVGGDAPISNENILPSILTNTAETSTTSTTQNSFYDRITVGSVGLLANQFSRIGTRTLGVETFEINPDVTGGFDPSGTRVTIGTYTLPNLYIFGSSYFDVNKGQEVGLEYRLSRHYLFEGRRDEFNLYHFSFKFNWEYK